eukprot:491154-Rhodomonas_salina.1
MQETAFLVQFELKMRLRNLPAGALGEEKVALAAYCWYERAPGAVLSPSILRPSSDLVQYPAIEINNKTTPTNAFLVSGFRSLRVSRFLRLRCHVGV